MEIKINPNRINRPVGGRANTQRERKPQEREHFVTPKRVEENFIPEPESLATMIRSAVAALRQGIHWDRGTILNLVV